MGTDKDPPPSKSDTTSSNKVILSADKFVSLNAKAKKRKRSKSPHSASKKPKIASNKNKSVAKKLKKVIKKLKGQLHPFNYAMLQECIELIKSRKKHFKLQAPVINATRERFLQWIVTKNLSAYQIAQYYHYSFGGAEECSFDEAMKRMKEISDQDRERVKDQTWDLSKMKLSDARHDSLSIKIHLSLLDLFHKCKLSPTHQRAVKVASVREYVQNSHLPEHLTAHIDKAIELRESFYYYWEHLDEVKDLVLSMSTKYSKHQVVVRLKKAFPDAPTMKDVGLMAIAAMIPGALNAEGEWPFSAKQSDAQQLLQERTTLIENWIQDCELDADGEKQILKFLWRLSGLSRELLFLVCGFKEVKYVHSKQIQDKRLAKKLVEGEDSGDEPAVEDTTQQPVGTAGPFAMEDEDTGDEPAVENTAHPPTMQDEDVDDDPASKDPTQQHVDTTRPPTMQDEDTGNNPTANNPTQQPVDTTHHPTMQDEDHNPTAVMDDDQSEDTTTQPGPNADDPPNPFHPNYTGQLNRYTAVAKDLVTNLCTTLDMKSIYLLLEQQINRHVRPQPHGYYVILIVAALCHVLRPQQGDNQLAQDPNIASVQSTSSHQYKYSRLWPLSLGADTFNSRKEDAITAIEKELDRVLPTLTEKSQHYFALRRGAIRPVFSKLGLGVLLEWRRLLKDTIPDAMEKMTPTACAKTYTYLGCGGSLVPMVFAALLGHLSTRDWEDKFRFRFIRRALKKKYENALAENDTLEQPVKDAIRIHLNEWLALNHGLHKFFDEYCILDKDNQPSILFEGTPSSSGCATRTEDDEQDNETISQLLRIASTTMSLTETFFSTFPKCPRNFWRLIVVEAGLRGVLQPNGMWPFQVQDEETARRGEILRIVAEVYSVECGLIVDERDSEDEEEEGEDSASMVPAQGDTPHPMSGTPMDHTPASHTLNTPMTPDTFPLSSSSRSTADTPVNTSIMSPPAGNIRTSTVNTPSSTLDASTTTDDSTVILSPTTPSHQSMRAPTSRKQLISTATVASRNLSVNTSLTPSKLIFPVQVVIPRMGRSTFKVTCDSLEELLDCACIGFASYRPFPHFAKHAITSEEWTEIESQLMQLGSADTPLLYKDVYGIFSNILMWDNVKGMRPRDEDYWVALRWTKEDAKDLSHMFLLAVACSGIVKVYKWDSGDVTYHRGYEPMVVSYLESNHICDTVMTDLTPNHNLSVPVNGHVYTPDMRLPLIDADSEHAFLSENVIEVKCLTSLLLYASHRSDGLTDPQKWLGFARKKEKLRVVFLEPAGSAGHEVILELMAVPAGGFLILSMDKQKVESILEKFKEFGKQFRETCLSALYQDDSEQAMFSSGQVISKIPSNKMQLHRVDVREILESKPSSIEEGQRMKICAVRRLTKSLQ